MRKGYIPVHTAYRYAQRRETRWGVTDLSGCFLGWSPGWSLDVP